MGTKCMNNSTNDAFCIRCLKKKETLLLKNKVADAGPTNIIFFFQTQYNVYFTYNHTYVASISFLFLFQPA